MDNNYRFDLSVRSNKHGIEVGQDVTDHLDWAKYQREMSKKSKAANHGFKPYCNIPDSVSLDIMTKYGINIHGQCDKDDLQKVKQIIKRDYPALMYY